MRWFIFVLVLAGIFITSVVCQVAKEPVLIFTFDDIDGDTVNDLSIFGNNGKLEDNPGVVNGKFGKALQFERSRVKVMASDSLGADLFKEGMFTLVLWINAKRTGDEWQQIFRAGPEPNDTLFINIDGRLSWRGMVGGAWAVMCETNPGVVETNTWIHVAVTSDTESFRIYVNGILSEESNFQRTDGKNTEYVIGGYNTGESYSGAVDDLVIFPEPIDEVRIRSIMNSGIKGTTNLQEGWNLISFSVNKCFYQGDTPNDQPNCVEKVNVNSLGFISLAAWFSSVIAPNDAWQMVIGSNGAMDSSLPVIFHTLKYMSPCSGYWVKIKDGVSNAVLSLDGLLFDPGCAVPLSEGWNQVGCPLGVGYYDTGSPPSGKHVPEGTIWVKVGPPVAVYVFSSIAGKYDMVIGEDGAYDPNLPSMFSSLHYVAPGYGYWVKMKEVASLIYSVSQTSGIYIR